MQPCQGKCPDCKKIVQTYKTGEMFAHLGSNGIKCVGSGTKPLVLTQVGR